MIFHFVFLSSLGGVCNRAHVKSIFPSSLHWLASSLLLDCACAALSSSIFPFLLRLNLLFDGFSLQERNFENFKNEFSEKDISSLTRFALLPPGVRFNVSSLK